MNQSPPLSPAIVLVDDDPNILNIMTRIVNFVAAGFEVVSANSGVEAMAVFDQRKVVLVITDYNMPEMDGLALLKNVKTRSPTTQVVFVTAYPSSDLQRQAMALGASRVLTKPMSIDQIEEVVTDAIKR